MSGRKEGVKMVLVPVQVSTEGWKDRTVGCGLPKVSWQQKNKHAGRGAATLSIISVKQRSRSDASRIGHPP